MCSGATHDLRASNLCELNGRNANTRSAGVDEDILAFLQSRNKEKCLVSSEPSFWDRCCLLEGQAVGLDNSQRFIHNGVLFTRLASL